MDDNTYTNKTWAEVSHLQVTDIHVMEVEFLSNMRYQLLVSADDWDQWLLDIASIIRYCQHAHNAVDDMSSTGTTLRGGFLSIFAWNLGFAALSVVTTFVLGMLLALLFNDERLKGRRLYRSILLMPYAVPGFIALLVWSNFYNQDFGLINTTLGINVNWLGDPTMAKVAVLLTNLWMGFPYMFIVSTGALQAIPGDVMEAARMDGANRFQTTMRVVTPLLLVAVAPLLVASFAFNFNNFNAIQLLTEGGPFLPGEYTRGGTDILISMIYRIAFGGSGADFGFASAVSVALFVLTGILAAIQFRFTNILEDVN